MLAFFLGNWYNIIRGRAFTIGQKTKEKTVTMMWNHQDCENGVRIGQKTFEKRVLPNIG